MTSTTSRPPSGESVALLGYGRFGRALGQLLTEGGVPHRAFDEHAEVPREFRADSLAELARGAAFVVVAVPVPRMKGALLALRPHLDPSQIVFDVGSVKVLPERALRDVLGDRIPWTGTHPLFGPLSLARAERPLRVVLCPAAAHPEAAARTRALYERIGCEVIVQTPEGHDRVMAHTHALTFFVAKGMIDAGAATEVPFAPPSFQAFARTIETVRSDAGHLFAAIARDNPFAPEARKELVRSLASIDAALDAEASSHSAPVPGADAGEPGETEPLSIPDLGSRSPELKETRDHVDAIDHEIVRLLGQRMQLSRRAARAKAALGAPVLDAAREAEVMTARRQWAGEARIDPDAVADVFRAIITMSRRGQR
jgi:prephenate dehydrogenase